MSLPSRRDVTCDAWLPWDLGPCGVSELSVGAVERGNEVHAGPRAPRFQGFPVSFGGVRSQQTTREASRQLEAALRKSAGRLPSTAAIWGKDSRPSISC